MLKWLADKRNSIKISTAVLCLIGMPLSSVFSPWQAWGIAGLCAGIITFVGLEKQKQTVWKALVIPVAESCTAGVAAYLVNLAIH
jgi:hypothetical protein